MISFATPADNRRLRDRADFARKECLFPMLSLLKDMSENWLWKSGILRVFGVRHLGELGKLGRPFASRIDVARRTGRDLLAESMGLLPDLATFVCRQLPQIFQLHPHAWILT